MFQRRISIRNAPRTASRDPLERIKDALAILIDLCGTPDACICPQQENSALAGPSIAVRYAAADSLTRRRFDALLSEVEAVTDAGMALILSRTGRSDAGTIAAARFLGTDIATSVRRLDSLLARHQP